MLLGIRLSKPKERQVDDKMRRLKLIVSFPHWLILFEIREK